MDTSRQTQSSGSGYKKHWGKWIAIYVFVAALAYLIIYLVAFNNGGGAGGTGGY